MITQRTVWQAGTGPETTVDARKVPTESDLRTLSTRELLVALVEVERELRATPFLVEGRVGFRVNPSVAPLLARQRAIAAQLRARRVSWSAAAGSRAPSAAWPPPPWN